MSAVREWILNMFFMDEQKEKPILHYCLYARKSSEDEERQAMSIDSQVKEMSKLAESNHLSVVAVKTEAHSAKNSGERRYNESHFDSADKAKRNHRQNDNRHYCYTFGAS